MRILSIVLGLSLLVATTVVAKAEELSAYSAVLGTFVTVKVAHVHTTKMSEQSFCTLQTGTYCNATLGNETQSSFLPTPNTITSLSFGPDATAK